MKYTKNTIIKESEESRELSIFIENNQEIYTNYILPITQSLKKYYKKGNYSREKAIAAYYPAAVAGARLYCKTFASLADFLHVFNVTARFTCAANLEESFFNLVEE